jgi:hypothetical protein
MQQSTKALVNKHFITEERKIKTPLLIISESVVILCLISCQPSTNKNLPIIDMHMHSYPVEYMGGSNIPNPVTGRPSGLKSDEELMLSTLSEMRSYNIVKAVTSGPLEVMYRWKSEGPKRLIGIHTGLGPAGTPYTCCPEFRVTYGNPVLLEEVLVKHPKLRLYIMHGGWPYLEETKAIMSIYPQVYADLATINWIIPREEFHEYFKDLIRAGFGKRLMFGSDQMVWPEAIGMAIGGIESVKFLLKEEKRDIFYNNAVRFLNLKETMD